MYSSEIHTPIKIHTCEIGCISAVLADSLYLTGLHFTGLHLTGLHLTGLHFTGLHLTGLHLTGLHFTGLHLTGLHLTRLHFTGLHLTGLHLTRLHFTGLYLTRLYLTRLHFTGLRLTGMHLSQARTRIVSPADKPSNCVPGYFPWQVRGKFASLPALASCQQFVPGAAAARAPWQSPGKPPCTLPTEGAGGHSRVPNVHLQAGLLPNQVARCPMG
jgi:hypothetical protein